MGNPYNLKAYTDWCHQAKLDGGPLAHDRCCYKDGFRDGTKTQAKSDVIIAGALLVATLLAEHGSQIIAKAKPFAHNVIEKAKPILHKTAEKAKDLKETVEMKVEDWKDSLEASPDESEAESYGIELTDE